jgi:DNA-binding NarL/FixJ family response regulator
MGGLPSGTTPPVDARGGRPIRVLIADDQPLVRAGIRMVLQHAPDIEVVAEAGDGDAAVSAVGEQPIDVALLDIQMPRTDGLTAAERIRAGAPDVRVVILTTFGEEEYVARALRAGAAGFLTKDASPEELIHGVRVAADGHAILSPGITQHLIRRYTEVDTGRAGAARSQVATLTPREREVLAMVGSGLSNAEIGRALQLVEGTVKTHVSRVLMKLNCANRVQAAIVAYDAGLVRMPHYRDDG